MSFIFLMQYCIVCQNIVCDVGLRKVKENITVTKCHKGVVYLKSLKKCHVFFEWHHLQQV